MTAPDAPVLEVEGVTGGYGGAEILHGVSVRVASSEIVVLIGPNGAGKSSVMNAVLGRLRIDGGRVRLAGTRHHRRSARAGRPPGGVLRAPDRERLPQPEREREPGDGGVHPHRRFPAADRGDVRALPPARGTPARPRRHAVRRPTPDGRDREGAHGRPGDPAARRADRGSLAALPGRHLPGGAPDQRARHPDPHGGAERAAGARDRRPRLRAGRRTEPAGGHRVRPPRRPRRGRDVSRRGWRFGCRCSRARATARRRTTPRAAWSGIRDTRSVARTGPHEGDGDRAAAAATAVSGPGPWTPKGAGIAGTFRRTTQESSPGHRGTRRP